VYLSKLTLNPRNRLARTDTANPYKMHQTLSRILEPEKNYLWRLEETVLLVQSQSRPDWGQLEPGYLGMASESKPFDVHDSFALDRKYRFRLHANPTVVKAIPKAEREPRVSGKPKTGKREGLYKLEEQIAWLHRQAERNGFELLDFMVSNSDSWRFKKDNSSDPMTLAVAEFDGHLRIANLETFQTCVQTGLGHGKAFGLGLLSLARTR
jgi:CRISPR system Cascade subunit CasE